MKPKLKRQRFANVWEALEDDPGTAANMTMRSDLLIALRHRIESWNVTQARAARRLGITPPKRPRAGARINKFSLDTLVNLANRAAIHVQLRIDEAA